MASPRVDSRTACVLWDPSVSAHVFPLWTHSPSRYVQALTNSLATHVTAVRDVESWHVRIASGGRSLQLLVQPAPVQAPEVMTTAIVPHRWLASRAIALADFNELLALGRLRPLRRRPIGRAQRLTAILRALDGARAGASHRNIAESLFGGKRVSRDWSDPGENLRDQVRRAVSAGRRLSAHGYLRLLQ